MKHLQRVLVGFVVLGTVGSAAAQPVRPQTPKAPFEYEVETLTIGATDEGIDQDFWITPRDGFTHELAATITLPDPEVHGPGPYPGLVLISGSGAQDRDSTILAHKPFAVLADRFTRAGIAVLRFDDRGFGESTGSFAAASVEQHGRDAWIAARTLMEHPKVHASKVGLVGHSQGGTLAPYIAAHDPDIAFLVLLAGTGVSGAEILIDQNREILKRSKKDESFVQESLRLRDEIHAALCAGSDDEEVIDVIQAFVKFEYGYQNDADARGLAEQIAPQFLSVPLRSFVCFDPRVWLRGTRIPVLAFNGSLDTQVTPRMNLDAIRGALHEAGNKQATIVEMAGINHLLQPAEHGAFGEYGRISTSVDERVLSLLESWIRSTVDSLE